jgi:PIN domain nuclease of toxin-antitoxin system
MLFVTDTHALIHHITGRKRRLGRKARSTFERVKRGTDAVLIPFTVLEEVMLLSEAGKVRLPLPFRDLVISLAQADNFDLGVNDMQLLLEAASFTTLPDPYDRLIIAQARVAGLPLIAGDGKNSGIRFGPYGVGLSSPESATSRAINICDFKKLATKPFPVKPLHLFRALTSGHRLSCTIQLDRLALNPNRTIDEHRQQ